MNVQSTVDQALHALAVMTDDRDHYKRELGMIREQEQESRVKQRLGLSGRQVELLMTLYARRGRVVTKLSLLDAMYGGMDEPDPKIIDVFVCKIRQRVPGSVQTVWGRGYLLTEAGVAVVEQALMVAQ